MSEQECKNYLKKIKIEKLGVTKCKESDNLKNFLQKAYLRRYLHYKI